MVKFLEEFKKFAVRGNVVDLAVAVVIGTAFGKIVSSLVDNIVMPFIGVIIGGVDFSTLAFQVGRASITYGVFLQAVVNFIVIAFVVFIAVRVMNAVVDKEEPKKDDKKPAEDILLLREIRDAVKGK